MVPGRKIVPTPAISDPMDGRGVIADCRRRVAAIDRVAVNGLTKDHAAAVEPATGQLVGAELVIGEVMRGCVLIGNVRVMVVAIKRRRACTIRSDRQNGPGKQ